MIGNNTKIRFAQEEDLSALLELYSELTPDDLPIDNELAKNIIHQIHSSNSFFILLLEHEKIPVASCAISIIPNLTRGGSPYSVIENVITRKANRKQGFGTQIMKAAIDFSNSKSCYKIMLLTGSDNKATHRFYKNLGFSGNSKRAYVIKKDVPKPAH